MRITNNIIRENAFANMRRGLEKMAESQERVSTGLRLQAASDDPSRAATAMTTRSSLRAIEQYRSGIGVAKLRASSEEVVLERLDDLLTRAKTLGISQATGTANSQTRQIARVELEGILRQAVGLANTELDGSYLFGGVTADVAPFALDESGASLDFTTAGTGGALEVEIAPRQRAVMNRSGSEVFGSPTSGVLASLRDLSTALGTDDIDQMLEALNGLNASQTHVQELTVSTGVRVNHLELTEANLDAMDANLVTLKSDLEEVDFEEAVTEMISRQTAYQAAMLATSRVMGLTLTDYLR